MADRTVRVATSAGIVEGLTSDRVHRWRAIPYGQPPVGPLRLRAPRAAAPWRGVRYCHEFESCAWQDRRLTRTGLRSHQPMSEDCLTLNVVAPASPHDGPLPVVFFVHGGGYLLGSAATPPYGGAALARRGCVYVSANYRLGALGCLDLSSLTTRTHPIDGNLFLRDLVLALRWVNRNIANFGGDPGNVTIFGQSAGGHAVASLLAVPEAAGLFHRAISESPPNGMVSSAAAAADFAEQFAAVLGADGEDGAAAVRAAKPWQLVAALQQLLRTATQGGSESLRIGPAVDGEYLPYDPVTAMATGQAHAVPLIVGHNAEEGRLFRRFVDYPPADEAAIERLLGGATTRQRTAITSAYPGYPHPRACLELGSDFAFGSMAWQIAEAHRQHAPTFAYRYDYAPRTLAWAGFGATHATELLAVFDVYRTRFGSLLTLAGDKGSALRVSNDVQGRWLQFSKAGVPGDGWPEYSRADRPVLVFDRQSRVEFDPASLRRQAWQGFNVAE